MRKSVAILLVLTFFAAFTPCVSAQVLPKIGLCIYKFDDTFISYMKEHIQAAAAGKAVLFFRDSQYDQPRQNDQVDQFISEGVNGLAVNMVDPSALPILIDKVRKKNLPLVLFNREPAAADMARYARVYYVGAKARESGTMQGEIVAQYWKSHPKADLNDDGVLQYVMLVGDPSNSDAKYRTEYSIRAVTDAGIKVQKLAEGTAMWDRPKAKYQMATWLAAYPGRIEVVFANNDDMALGAIDALKAEGYFKGGRYMPVVGVDATPPALKALDQGSLLGSVLNDAAKQGQATFDLVYALSLGKSASASTLPLANAEGLADPNGHYVWVPYVKVTRDNYRQFLKN